MTNQERLTSIAYRLMLLGVSGQMVSELMNQYNPDEIEKQLDWLPLRKAKRPEALIITAIKKRYSQPYIPRHAKTHHEPQGNDSLDQGAEPPR